MLILPTVFPGDASNKRTSKLSIEIEIKIESAGKNFRCKFGNLVGLT